MKKVVITAFDVSTAKKAGQTSLAVPEGALVTPQAADDARDYGISLVRGGSSMAPLTAALPCAPGSASAVSPSTAVPNIAGKQGVGGEPGIADAVRQQVLARLGSAAPASALTSLDAVISAVMAALPDAASGGGTGTPFIRRAGTVTHVDSSALPSQGNVSAGPAAVAMVEAAQPGAGQPGIGYMNWENASFSWTFTHAEVLVVLEGELTLTVGGSSLTGRTGDSFLIPAQSAVTLAAKGRVRCVHSSWPNPETAKG